VTPHTQRYRWVELAGMGLYFTWLLALVYHVPSGERLYWALTAHAVAGVLHVQILLSHYVMPVYSGRPYNDASDEWYTMQLRTCMDVQCDEKMDWFHGGLQFQIEHHIFPRLPRHNLRHAQTLIKQVCKEHGIPYREETFFQGNVTLLSTLARTASAVRQTKLGDGGFYESAIYEGLRLVG